MRNGWYIGFLALLLLLPLSSGAQERQHQEVSFEFYGDTLGLALDRFPDVPFDGPLSEEAIRTFYKRMNEGDYAPVTTALLSYKKDHRPDDWMYYQLIRRVAQQLSPKSENYIRYTLYKWFLLLKSGYGSLLSINGDKILFYVQCDEKIYDIPSRMHEGQQYICLNYHDYGNIDFEKNTFKAIAVREAQAGIAFSYRLTQLPRFRPEDYSEKSLEFNYHNVDYRFRVKLNDQVKTLFANYPVADYELYFNAPLSSETYRSLIPQLRKNIEQMDQRSGVDYLMRFTRYAFLYEADKENFGKEKRLSPEQTLLYSASDCEDRAALFFCLVKEIYNLPMIVVVFPQHVTIGVKFDKPIGKPIIYNGSKYSLCEPTPQGQDLPLGKWSRELQQEQYEVAYAYQP